MAFLQKSTTCLQCGYDMSRRVQDDPCPECGSQFDNRPTLRHSWNSLRLSSIFSLISVLLFIVPLITTGKYYPLLPLVQGFFVIAAGLLVAWHASKARGTRNEDLEYRLGVIARTGFVVALPVWLLGSFFPDAFGGTIYSLFWDVIAI